MKQRTFIRLYARLDRFRRRWSNSPTVEQTTSLRLIPNLETWRPCDQVESAIAWQQAVERNDVVAQLVGELDHLRLNRSSHEYKRIKCVVH